MRPASTAELPLPDFDLIQRQLSQPVLFDGCNMFEPARMAKKGFTYYSVGRLSQR